jgi:bifunctional non-homologous end joining protein LigD
MTWLKTKCFTESEFVIIGTDRDRKTGATRALLAQADQHGLSYAGAAFIALPPDEGDQLHLRLDRYATDRSPLAHFRKSAARWVKPKIVARVRHLAASSSVRHATVRAIL